MAEITPGNLLTVDPWTGEILEIDRDTGATVQSLGGNAAYDYPLAIFGRDILYYSGDPASGLRRMSPTGSDLGTVIPWTEINSRFSGYQSGRARAVDVDAQRRIWIMFGTGTHPTLGPSVKVARYLADGTFDREWVCTIPSGYTSQGMTLQVTTHSVDSYSETSTACPKLGTATQTGANRNFEWWLIYPESGSLHADGALAAVGLSRYLLLYELPDGETTVSPTVVQDLGGQQSVSVDTGGSGGSPTTTGTPPTLGFAGGAAALASGDVWVGTNEVTTWDLDWWRELAAVQIAASAITLGPGDALTVTVTHNAFTMDHPEIPGDQLPSASIQATTQNFAAGQWTGSVTVAKIVATGSGTVKIETTGLANNSSRTWSYNNNTQLGRDSGQGTHTPGALPSMGGKVTNNGPGTITLGLLIDGPNPCPPGVMGQYEIATLDVQNTGVRQRTLFTLTLRRYGSAGQLLETRELTTSGNTRLGPPEWEESAPQAPKATISPIVCRDPETGALFVLVEDPLANGGSGASELWRDTTRLQQSFLHPESIVGTALVVYRPGAAAGQGMGAWGQFIG